MHISLDHSVGYGDYMYFLGLVFSSSHQILGSVSKSGAAC